MKKIPTTFISFFFSILIFLIIKTSKINIKGSLDEKPSLERFDGNILIDNKSSVDFIGNIKK